MGNLIRIKQEGVKIGEKKGEKRGEQRMLKSIFNNLLAHGIDQTKAAQLLGLTPKKLKALLSA